MPILNKFLKNKYLALIFRLILGGIFIYASFDKIAHPADFARIVYNYHFLPGSVINIFAIILPWVELLAGMALILGMFVESAALLVGTMLVVFVVGLTSAMIRGLDISCGCFSTAPSSEKVVWDTIIRDLIYMILVVQVYYGYGGFWSVGKFLEKKKQ
jgi:uncharacterized membrane protein YphA (DoxX/SURF4 family)